MKWESNGDGFWRKETPTQLAHCWRSGLLWHWSVISRHQVGRPSKVIWLGRGKEVSLVGARAQADEVLAQEVKVGDKGVWNEARPHINVRNLTPPDVVPSDGVSTDIVVPPKLC